MLHATIKETHTYKIAQDMTQGLHTGIIETHMKNSYLTAIIIYIIIYIIL